jgi:hypothetical protein
MRFEVGGSHGRESYEYGLAGVTPSDKYVSTNVSINLLPPPSVYLQTADPRGL